MRSSLFEEESLSVSSSGDSAISVRLLLLGVRESEWCWAKICERIVATLSECAVRVSIDILNYYASSEVCLMTYISLHRYCYNFYSHCARKIYTVSACFSTRDVVYCRIEVYCLFLSHYNSCLCRF